MPKLDTPLGINWGQFITTIAISIVVSAGGATIALLTSQASTGQRLYSLEARTASIERTNEKLSDTLIAVRESLARIEGAVSERNHK